MTDSWIKQIVKDFPILSKKEERELIEQYKHDPEYLAGRLWKHNIAFIVGRCRKHSLEFDLAMSASWVSAQNAVKAMIRKDLQYRFITIINQSLRSTLAREVTKRDRHVLDGFSLDATTSDGYTEHAEQFADESIEEYSDVKDNLQELMKKRLKPRDVEIMNLYASGLNFVEIGKKMNVSTQAIQQKFWKNCEKLRGL